MFQKSAELCERLPIHAFEDDWIVLEDGSVALGYTVHTFEDEALAATDYEAFTKLLAHTLKPFAVGTLLQKIDVYYADGAVLRHRTWLYLIVGHGTVTEPQHTFYARGKALIETPFDHLSERIETLQQQARELEAALSAHWHLQRHTKEQNLQALYAYLNLSFAQPPTGFEHTLHHTPQGLQLGHHHVQVVSMLSQAEEPHYFSHNQLGHNHGVTSPFLWPLTHYLPFPHLTVQVIRLLDTEAHMARWSEELAWSEGATTTERAQRQAGATRDEVAAFDEALRTREEHLVEMALLLILYHAEAKTLGERVEQTKTAIKRLGMQPLVETYDAANLFVAALPAAAGQCYRGLVMPLETALAQLNTITPRKGAQEGILLADRHGTPLYYDPFNAALDNQNAFVFGPSGSGKSFFNGKMIKERYEAGHLVLVIDSGGTYRRLFEVLGGRYIEYSATCPLQLNPFLIQKQGDSYVPTLTKINFLTQLLGKMWKGDLNQHPMEEAEKALLARWLPAYYAQEQGIPTLRRFYDWLQAYVKDHAAEVDELSDLFPFQDFFVVLEPFAHGAYAEHFNAETRTHLTDHALICFELEAVKSHPKLYPLVVQTLFELAFELVEAYPEKKKFIDIEEGWSMLDDYSEENIEAFFRKGRKTKTAIRLITQDIEEIKGSRIAGAMVNNASTSILLYNDKAASRAAIADFLGMNALEAEKYASLRRHRHYREVLIKEMNTAHVWRVEVSAAEHAALTSKPEERDRISQLIAQQGDVHRGIAAWVREQA